MIRHAFLGFCALLIGCAAPSSAQSPSPVVGTFVSYSGWVEPVLRDSIIARWWNPDSMAVELGACVTRYTVIATARRVETPGGAIMHIDSAFYVWSAERVKSKSTPISSRFKCAPGAPRLHSHPAATCTEDAEGTWCRPGGWGAYQCQASTVDYGTLMATKAPFSIVMCGPQQLAFYYPRDVRGGSYVSASGLAPPKGIAAVP